MLAVKYGLQVKETQSFDQNHEMAEAVISCLPKLKKNNFLLSEEYINFLKKKAVVPGRQELLIGKNNVNLINLDLKLLNTM